MARDEGVVLSRGSSALARAIASVQGALNHQPATSSHPRAQNRSECNRKHSQMPKFTSCQYHFFNELGDVGMLLDIAHGCVLIKA